MRTTSVALIPRLRWSASEHQSVNRPGSKRASSSPSPPGRTLPIRYVRVPPVAPEAEVVRVLAVVDELHDRGAGLDRLAGEGIAELVGADLEPRRGGEASGARARSRSSRIFGRANASARRDDRSRRRRRTTARAARVERRGSRRSRAGCRRSSSFARPGTRRSSGPFTREPIRKPAPGGAVVGAVRSRSPSARRPNSDQTWTSTRSASPRASRSRWNASRRRR